MKTNPKLTLKFRDCPTIRPGSMVCLKKTIIMKLLPFILSASIALSLVACKKNDDLASCPNSVPATFKDLTGLDGCGMVLELSDGSRLEDANLSELNLTPADGLKVRVKYSDAPGMASICMVGPIVRVDCIVPE